MIGYTMFRNVSPWPDTTAGRANIDDRGGLGDRRSIAVIVAAPQDDPADRANR